MQRNRSRIVDPEDAAFAEGSPKLGYKAACGRRPIFWDALEAAAAEEALPLNALIARIDVVRLDAAGGGPNLTSALRQWLFAGAKNAVR